MLKLKDILAAANAKVAEYMAQGYKNHIESQKEFNRSLRTDPAFRNCLSLYVKVFTLKQYADRRRSTDLTRFSFCPDCGKRIDWKSIAEEPRPP